MITNAQHSHPSSLPCVAPHHTTAHHSTPEQITYIAYLRRAAAPSAHDHAASRTVNGAAAAAPLPPSNGQLTPRSTQLSPVAQPKPIAMFNEIAMLHLACWGCFPWADASCGVCCVPEAMREPSPRATLQRLVLGQKLDLFTVCCTDKFSRCVTSRRITIAGCLGDLFHVHWEYSAGRSVEPYPDAHQPAATSASSTPLCLPCRTVCPWLLERPLGLVAASQTQYSAICDPSMLLVLQQYSSAQMVQL